MTYLKSRITLLFVVVGRLFFLSIKKLGSNNLLQPQLFWTESMLFGVGMFYFEHMQMVYELFLSHDELDISQHIKLMSSYIMLAYRIMLT